MVANTTVAEQTKFQRFFASICSTWIEERNRAKCNKAKDLVTLVGSLAVSILGLLGALQIHWLLIIAIVVAACTITIFLGLQYVANLIDKEEVNEINALKSQILELSNSNRANETLYQEEKEYNKYLACLWTETSLLAKAKPLALMLTMLPQHKRSVSFTLTVHILVSGARGYFLRLYTFGFVSTRRT